MSVLSAFWAQYLSWHPGPKLNRIHLNVPFLVYSSLPENGGQLDHITDIINHQACEGSGHEEQHQLVSSLGLSGYPRHICMQQGLQPDKSLVLSTAAGMSYTSIVEKKIENIQVLAITTAGVHGNAGRAGDEANWIEVQGKYTPFTPHSSTTSTQVNCSVSYTSEGQAPPQPGTINTLLFIGAQLLPGVLGQAFMTAVEAKAAAMQLLAVPSKASRFLATGTGTDQLVVASLAQDQSVYTSAGKHVLLGQLTGQAVSESILEALKWQNGLYPEMARHLFHILGRFGTNEEAFLQRVQRYLSPAHYALMRANPKSLFYDPALAGAATALAAVCDRLLAGTFPPPAWSRILAAQWASLSSALAQDYALFNQFYIEMEVVCISLLNNSIESIFNYGNFEDMLARSIALGWSHKWI